MTNAPSDLVDMQADLGVGLALIKKRAPEAEKGRDYYEGTRAEVHANPELARILEQSAEAHPLSFAHIPVDALLDRVELTGITSASNADKLKAELEAVEYMDDADDWHTRAGYMGDYYVIIDPLDEDDQGRATDVQLVGASPLSSVVVYDARTQRVARFGVRAWHEPKGTAGGYWRATIFYSDATVHLTTAEGKGPDYEPRPADFVLDITEDDAGDGETAIERHAVGEPLLEHFAIDGRPYGRPLHSKAYGPQDALTKISASNLANLDAIVFPARYALLDPSAEVDDDDLDDADPTHRPAGTGQREAPKRTRPGTITMLRGVKEAGTFEAGEGSIFLENADWYVRAIALATGTPVFEFDLKGEQPSGEARRRAEARLVRHARKVSRSLTATHARIADKIARLKGFEVGDVTVAFAPLETSTDAEGIELVGKKIANGVAPRDALLEAGYTVEQVDRWLGKGDDGRSTLTIEAVAKLAGALAQLGQAQTLGVITATELRALLPQVFTEARGEGSDVTLTLDAEPVEGTVETSAADEASAIKSKADALGILVRAGADAAQAAAALGLPGIDFPNVPTTVRIPDDAAAGLEGSGAAAPAAPAAPEPPAPEA